MWKDLSIQQKSEVMKMAISQGLTDLNEIKKMYDASIPNIEASSVNNTYSSVPYNPSPKDVRYAYGGPLGNIYKGTGNKSQKLKKPSGPLRFSNVVDMIKHFEGFRATPYKDGKDKKTGTQWYSIGYGFNDSGFHRNIALQHLNSGKAMSRAEADKLIVSYIDNLDKQLKNVLGSKLYSSLTPGQKMAYIDTGYQNPSVMYRAARIHKNTNDLEKTARALSIANFTDRNNSRYHTFMYGPKGSGLDGTKSAQKNLSNIDQNSPIYHHPANDLVWNPPTTEITTEDLNREIAPLLIQDNKPLIVEPLDNPEPSKSFDDIWDQIFPKVENTQEEFNPLLDPSTQFTALQSRPRYQMKPTPIINMPVSSGDNDYMLFKPLAKGGNLFDTGSYLRNYQWRTMPETDVTYNDYNTGLPIQAGSMVWTDENGNIVTADTPNAAADYAIQYGNPTFELNMPEITIEGLGNGKSRGHLTGESFEDRYARLLAAPIAKNADVDNTFKEQNQQLVDFEIEKERQHRANEEFNRQVDNFFGANWLRPSQLVGAFNPGGVDDGVTFGERFLLGTNNYGLWNSNSEFLGEHPYLAEGANILFDLAAPQAIINGVPEMTRAAANAARKGAINTAARASFYFPQKDAAAKASQLWRNQEYNNFLNTVNGDNYYELVQSTANRPKVYRPNEEYFISHTAPWAEFAETGNISNTVKTEAGIADRFIDPAYFVNAKNKLYEFPHETFGDLQSTGAALGKMKKVYDTPVRDLGEAHLKYGNLSSGPRGEVSTMGNFPNTYRQGWGLTERPLLKTLAYPEGIYDYNPIYENIFRGPQTIVTGDELTDALLHSNYNIYERTPNGVQRTIFLGEPEIRSTAAGGSEHNLGIGFEGMDFSSSPVEKNILDRYIYGQIISGENIVPRQPQQLQLGLDPEVAEYLMKNKVGRDVQALIDEGLTNPEIAAARGEGKRELLENVRVGEYSGDEYTKAGMEHSGGFFNEDKNFISVNRDSGFPKGFVQKHEGTHLLDKYTTLTDAQETALSSAYGKDFEALSDWDQADDWLKGYKHMQKERVTTNRDARDVLLGDYQKFDIHQQNLIIDRMSDEKIVDAVRKANGYGRNYIAYLEQTGGLTPKKIKQFREAMKKVGVVTGVAAVGASAVTN